MREKNIIILTRFYFISSFLFAFFREDDFERQLTFTELSSRAVREKQGKKHFLFGFWVKMTRSPRMIL